MKETLEEAAENYSKITLNKQGLMSDNQVNGFIAGAKWQQERMYTEEEVKHIVSEALQSALVTVNLDGWFEQFKKK